MTSTPSPTLSSESEDSWPSIRQIEHCIAKNQFNSFHWSYLAEGGKNLLVRYTGPTAPSQDNPWVSPDGSRALALRIEKRARKAGQQGPQMRRVNVDYSRYANTRSDATLSTTDVDRREWELSVATNLLRGLVPSMTAPFDNYDSPTSSQPGSPAPEPWAYAEDCRLSPMLPFVYPLHYDRGDPHPLLDFLVQLANRIEASRPPSRRAKDEIDVDCPDIIDIIEDMTWAPPGCEALCVEIKPKWLFTTDKSSEYSRYRRHAILKSGGKLTPQEVNDLYEPLDLASRQDERTVKAMRALVKNWRQGGNNLRVFDSGKRLPEGGLGSAMSAESEAVFTSMVHRLFGRSKLASWILKKTCNVEDAATASVDELLVAILSEVAFSPMFEALIVRLTYLQQALCPGGKGDLSHLDHLWRLYRPGSTLRRALQQGDAVHRILGETTMGPWDDFITDWITSEDHQRGEFRVEWRRDEAEEVEAEEEAAAATSTTPAATAGSKRTRSDMDGSNTESHDGQARGNVQDEDGDALDKLARKGVKVFSTDSHRREEAMRNAVLGALCSGAFKDCSIWIRIPLPPPITGEAGDQATSRDDESTWFDAMTINLIDVDVKPISKLERWMQLDEDIEECFSAWKQKHGIQEGARRVRRRVE